MTLFLYILRELFVSILFSASGIAVVVMPTVAIHAIHKLGAVGFGALLTYLPLVLVELVPYLLPMAFLIGVVMTYGRLAADREITAIRMTGIHPVRLALPGLLLAVPMSLGTAYLLTTVSPNWKYEQRNFQRSVDKEAFRSLAQGRTELEFGSSSMKALRREGDVFYDVLLDLEGADDEHLTVMADAVELAIRGDDEDVLVLEFENAHVLGEGTRLFDEYPSWSTPLADFYPSSPKDRSRPKYQTNAQMQVSLLDPAYSERERRAMRYEMHARYALAGTYVLFLLLGIPTGITLRSATQLAAFTGASGYAFVYYALAMQLGKSLARSGNFPPLPAAWATNALFLAAGIYLFRRALLK